MKRKLLPVALELLVCLDCYQLAKGVICSRCKVNLCWPCMSKHKGGVLCSESR